MSSSRESARAFAPLLLAAALLCAFALTRQNTFARQQEPSAEAVRQLLARVRGEVPDDREFSQARDLGYLPIRAARFEEAAALLGALAERGAEEAGAPHGAALAPFPA